MATDFVDSTAFSLSTATAGNTQDITISGFGSASDIIGFMIFATGLVTADDTITAEGDLSIGFGDGTNEYVQQIFCEDANTTTQTRRLQRTDAVIYHVNTSGSVQHAFSFNSFITDGIRLDIDNQAAGAYKCTLVLIRGDVGSSSKVVVKDDLGTGTSAVAITGVGFISDWVTSIQTGDNAALPNSNVQGLVSFGMWVNDGSNTQRSCAIGNNNNQGSAVQSQSYLSTTEITGQNLSGARQYGAVLDNVGSDGFDITPNASAGSDIVAFLCIKWGGSPETAIFTTTIPTVSPYAETGAGFTNTVDFGLMCSLEGVTAVNTLITADNYGLSLTTFNGTTVQTVNLLSEDAAATSVEKTVHNLAFKMYNNDGSTVEVVGSSITLDAAGWDIPMSTAPAANLLGFGFAFAEAGVAGGRIMGSLTGEGGLAGLGGLAGRGGGIAG